MALTAWHELALKVWMHRRAAITGDHSLHIRENAIRLTALVEGASVNGAVKPLFTFAESLRALGRANECRIGVVAFSRSPNTEENELTREAARLDIPVTTIHERRAFDSSILAQLVRCVSNQQPDIIQTNASKSHFLVKLLQLQAKHTWVAFHHGYTRIDAKNIVYNHLDHWSLRSARKVVTVCDSFVPQVRRCGVLGENIRVLHNPVKPHTSSAAKDQRSCASTQRLNLLAVGRLSQEKGHIHLIEALGLLKLRCDLPDFVLNIVGDGPERRSLEHRSKELGLEANICFRGYQPCVSPWYDATDIFILPSLSEGSPNVLLEALAAGLCVLATAAGGIPEIVQHEAEAILVRPADVSDLAGNLHRLMCDRDLRRRLAERAHTRGQAFYPKHYTEALLNEFRHCCSSNLTNLKPTFLRLSGSTVGLRSGLE